MSLKKRKNKQEIKRSSSKNILNKNNKKLSISTDDKLNLILSKLDSLEKNQKKIEKEEESMISLEKEEIAEEKVMEHNEEQELDELKKLETLEEDIKKELSESPLRRITYKDVTKGIIGAFFGVVGHFAFAKGPELAEHFSFFRSTLLFIVSFVIILLFLYFSGFKNVKDELFMKFFPLRAIVIYFSAIITIIVVLLLYGKIYFGMPLEHIYNTVAAISLLAVMGAATADLIGKNE